MEYLDIYDENGNYIGKEQRDAVHKNALWHKTVHCWLYDKDGNVYFQKRADEGTLYTTASGHLRAGESVREAFGREIKEEIGCIIDHEKAQMVGIVKFTMDKIKKDGSIFKDRVFANVYVCEFNEDINVFNFDFNEVSALVLVSAKEVLKLFKKGNGSINGKIIINNNNVNIEKKINVGFEDFLVNEGETAIGKYGDVLNKIIELTLKNDKQ